MGPGSFLSTALLLAVLILAWAEPVERPGEEVRAVIARPVRWAAIVGWIILAAAGLLYPIVWVKLPSFYLASPQSFLAWAVLSAVLLASLPRIVEAGVIWMARARKLAPVDAARALLRPAWRRAVGWGMAGAAAIAAVHIVRTVGLPLLPRAAAAPVLSVELANAIAGEDLAESWQATPAWIKLGYGVYAWCAVTVFALLRVTLWCGYLFPRCWAPWARGRLAVLAAALAVGVIASIDVRPGLGVAWSSMAYGTAHMAILCGATRQGGLPAAVAAFLLGPPLAGIGMHLTLALGATGG